MATQKTTPTDEISGTGLWVAAALIGFFAVPMLADASPRFVNSFLLLVLFSSLLLNRDRWLPYMAKLNIQATSSGGGGGGSGKKKK